MNPIILSSPVLVDGQPSTDINYGPWSSISEYKDYVQTTLGSTPAVGTTIGVKEDGVIVEYWNPAKASEFVKKGEQHIDTRMPAYALDDHVPSTSLFKACVNEIEDSIHDSKITIKQGGSSYEFTLNQSSNATIELATGGGGGGDVMIDSSFPTSPSNDHVPGTKLVKDTLDTKLSVSDAEATYQPKGDYLTEHQPIKTINNQSLIGTGNITISGGGSSVTIDTSIPEYPVDTQVPSTKLLKTQLEKKLDVSSASNTYLTKNSASNTYETKSHAESTYLTEHQPLKTINNQSIIGSGNITISGGGEAINIDTNWSNPTDTAVPSTKLTKQTLDAKLTKAEADEAYATADHNHDSVYLKPADAEAAYQPKGDYLTEHQSIKTINGQMLVGTGNIEIGGGGSGEDTVLRETLGYVESPVTGYTITKAVNNTNPISVSFIRNQTYSFVLSTQNTFSDFALYIRDHGGKFQQIHSGPLEAGITAIEFTPSAEFLLYGDGESLYQYGSACDQGDSYLVIMGTQAAADCTRIKTLEDTVLDLVATKADIDAIHDGTVTINQGGVKKGEFTLNQSGNVTIDLAAGGGGGGDITIDTSMPSTPADDHVPSTRLLKSQIGDGKVKFVDADGNELGSIHMNQTSNETITLPGGGGGSGADTVLRNLLDYQSSGSEPTTLFTLTEANNSNNNMVPYVMAAGSHTINLKSSRDIDSIDLYTWHATQDSRPTYYNNIYKGPLSAGNNTITFDLESDTQGFYHYSGTIPAITIDFQTGSATGPDCKRIADLESALDAKANKSEIGNATITINQGGTKKGEFTLNQSGNVTIDLSAGGGGGTDVGNGTITLKGSSGTTYGSFTTNQSTNSTITIPTGGGSSIDTSIANKFLSMGRNYEFGQVYDEIPAIMFVGQSNTAGRIAGSSFPSSVTWNGKAVSMTRSISSCQHMRMCPEQINRVQQYYSEAASKEFSAYSRQSTDSWSFADIIVPLVADYIGAGKPFAVVSCVRGDTSFMDPRGAYIGATFYPDISIFGSTSVGRGDISRTNCLSLAVIAKLMTRSAFTKVPKLSFKAIFMHQGEGDRGRSNPASYGDDVANWIYLLRGMVDNESCPFIFGSVPANSSQYSAEIYQAMQTVASTVPFTHLVTMPNASSWVQDGLNVHFGASDAIKLATDMMDIVKANEYIVPAL